MPVSMLMLGVNVAIQIKIFFRSFNENVDGSDNVDLRFENENFYRLFFDLTCCLIFFALGPTFA